MKTYLLIVWIATNHGGGPVVVGEFATKERCENAVKTILEASHKRYDTTDGNYVCTPK